MALYLCSFKNITRSEGRSTVAAAAYRSGEKLTNRWDGCTHDYTHKGGIEYTAILLPSNAPAAYADRSVLWNAVEQAEKSSRCRLCRECVLALPVELTLDQQIEVVTDYVRRNFTGAGMCADVAIHNPVKTDNKGRPLDAQGKPTDDPARFQRLNPHAHILLTVRPIDRNGKWEPKSQVEYRCKRGKEEKGFTAAEYQSAAAQGWEKQYRYKSHGKKIWLTPSEAVAQGLDAAHRVSRAPRTTPHGCENPTTAHWNSPLRINEWRESWADLVNRKFEALGMPERIDHRSYLDQGKVRLPSAHLGPHAANNTLELNETVRAFNDSLREYQRIDSVLRSKLSETSRRINACQTALATKESSAAALGRSVSALSRLTAEQEDETQKAQATLDLMLAVTNQAMDMIRLLEQELGRLSRFQPKRRNDLLARIQEIQKKLDDQTLYLQSVLKRGGFSDQASVDLAQAELGRKRQELSLLTKALRQTQTEADQLRHQLSNLISGVPDELRSKVLSTEPLAPSQQRPKPRHQ